MRTMSGLTRKKGQLSDNIWQKYTQMVSSQKGLLNSTTSTASKFRSK